MLRHDVTIVWVTGMLACHDGGGLCLTWITAAACMLLQTAVSDGGSLFKQLPPETQAILRPFLHSKYTIQSTRESAGGGTTAAPGASGGDAGGASLPPQPLARSASDASAAATIASVADGARAGWYSSRGWRHHCVGHIQTLFLPSMAGTVAALPGPPYTGACFFVR